jgi:hypothetical protein
VLTLVSSFPAVAFVTGNNVNLAFAKKHDSTNGGSSSSGNSGGGSSSDNSGGGSSSSSGNSGGQTTTGGSDNSNGGGSSGASNMAPASPSTTQTTCPDGSKPDANGICPTTTSPSNTTSGKSLATNTLNSTTQTTCPGGSKPDANGICPTTTSPLTTQTTCPGGSKPDANGNCPITTPSTQETTPLHTLAQQTCPPLPIDANGNCPGVDMRGGGLGLPPAPTPMSTSQQGNCVSGAHMTRGDPNNCTSDDVPYDDGTCPPGRIYIPGPDRYPCSTTATDYHSIPMSITKLPDGSCPAGYHNIPPLICGINIEQKLPDGSCRVGTISTVDRKLSTDMCVIIPVLPGSTTGAGGGFIQMIPICVGGVLRDANGKCPTPTSSPTTQTGNTGGTGGTTTTPIPVSPANGLDPTSLKPKCQSGYHFVDPTHCVADSFKCPSGTNENVAKLVCEPIQAPSGTTTTTTSAKTTTTTTTTPKQTGTTSSSTGTPTSTSKATTTKIINNKNVVRGPSAPSGGAGTHAPTTPFITYANTLNKITIRYPSTWTKTEFAGNNPSVPVLFNAPTTTASTGSKTTFMVIVNKLAPPITTLDNYTLQQLYGLTHSNTTKYTITATNATELTPPTGITAYHEISYNGMKNSVVNNVPVLVPLKGTAIFFVKGDTGYSLLYLAKQIDYPQQLPMIQQMINSFQAGNATTASGTGVGSSSGTITNSG